jgi:diaminohydroxyphosphoribosylaminopyrimidine deaminase/5-amino-6-(5-phosphoribosylamino)uracil reductase
MVVSDKITAAQKKAYVNLGAEVLELPAQKGLLNLESLITRLGEKQITSLLVEGGATLLGSLCDGNFVDKATVFISPIIIGGDKARTAVGGKGTDKVVNALKLERVKTKRFDNDMMFTGYIRRE